MLAAEKMKGRDETWMDIPDGPPQPFSKARSCFCGTWGTERSPAQG